MITIINCGGSNLASVCNALDRLDAPWQISNDPDQIFKADKVLLPGVGHASQAMAKIEKASLQDLLPKLTQPTLGICLGMQLLFESSEEGDTECLKIMPGRVHRIPESQGLSLPHIGWNRLLFQGRSDLLKGIDEGSFMYFVHSYQAPMGPETKAYCEYGCPVPAVVERDNFFGAQFHPEKSAQLGQKLLGNFLAL